MSPPYHHRGHFVLDPTGLIVVAVVPPVSTHALELGAADVARALTAAAAYVVCDVCGAVTFDHGDGYTHGERAVIDGWRRAGGRWRCPADVDVVWVERPPPCLRCRPYVCQCEALRQCTHPSWSASRVCQLPAGHPGSHANFLLELWWSTPVASRDDDEERDP